MEREIPQKLRRYVEEEILPSTPKATRPTGWGTSRRWWRTAWSC